MSRLGPFGKGMFTPQPTGNNSLSVYAAGTAYQFTNAAALLDFGTTDPSLTITGAGTYLILSRATLFYNAATFVAPRVVTLKLRRTNNTAADVITTLLDTDVTTTVSATYGSFVLPPVIYTTTNSDDIIQLFGHVATVPSAGTLDATSAEIVAIRLS